MRVFYQLEDLPPFKRAVLTIGSFDGVHSGHQQLLARINRLAHQSGGESIVITFHPHPRQVIYPKDDSLQLLSTIEEKVALFERYGVDNVIVVPFTVAFSQLSADEYIQRFLVDKFHPATIVIGYDHKFGLNRQGDIEYLKWHSKDAGFKVVEIEQQEVDDIAVSSTKIRNALLSGKVQEACRWLNHEYSLTGKVVHGQKLGTKLGFPTANIQPTNKHKLVPADGIYAVKVHHQDEAYGGMLYIGSRPSIAGIDERVIEVNIFDFDQNVYGQELTITLVEFIRGDQHFSDLEGLKAQLAEDRTTSLELLEQGSGKAHFVTGNPEVAVVILNYNGAKYLQEFLPSVLESLAQTEYRLIVADNASTDDSLDILHHEFPQVEVLRLEKNHGFAGGYNAALAQVEADYFVLLNSDVKVTKDWLQPCIAQMEADPELAACQPKIKSFARPKYFEYAGAAGGWIDVLGYPFCRGRIFATVEKDKQQYEQEQEIFWASGAAMFVRADLFRSFGGFDADYFAHAEEIDLCWRFKRAGFSIKAIPSSVVYHLGGGTLAYQSVRKTYLNFHNTLVTSFKNESRKKLLWWLPLRLFMDALAGGLFLLQGKWQHIGAIVRAHWHFFPRIGYWMERRKSYNALINSLAIGPENKEGIYRGSIVWAYYGRRTRSFRKLPKQRLNG